MEGKRNPFCGFTHNLELKHKYMIQNSPQAAHVGCGCVLVKSFAEGRSEFESFHDINRNIVDRPTFSSHTLTHTRAHVHDIEHHLYTSDILAPTFVEVKNDFENNDGIL